MNNWPAESAGMSAGIGLGGGLPPSGGLRRDGPRHRGRGAPPASGSSCGQTLRRMGGSRQGEADLAGRVKLAPEGRLNVRVFGSTRQKRIGVQDRPKPPTLPESRRNSLIHTRSRNELRCNRLRWTPLPCPTAVEPIGAPQGTASKTPQNQTRSGMQPNRPQCVISWLTGETGV